MSKKENEVKGLEFKTCKKIENVAYSVWNRGGKVETVLFGHGANGWNWENRLNALWNADKIKGDCVGLVIRLEVGNAISKNDDLLGRSREWETVRGVSKWLGSRKCEQWLNNEGTERKTVIYWSDFKDVDGYVAFMAQPGHVDSDGDWVNDK